MRILIILLEINPSARSVYAHSSKFLDQKSWTALPNSPLENLECQVRKLRQSCTKEHRYTNTSSCILNISLLARLAAIILDLSACGMPSRKHASSCRPWSDKSSMPRRGHLPCTEYEMLVASMWLPHKFQPFQTGHRA